MSCELPLVGECESAVDHAETRIVIQLREFVCCERRSGSFDAVQLVPTA